MSEETATGGPNVRFQQTLWTMVLEAKQGTAESVDRLVALYWKPVYFFIRRRGYSIEDAKDLTQSYFATFLEKDFLKDVSPDRGRFRSFVLATVAHFLSNEAHRARAKKRGGDFDFVRAETEIVSAEAEPEKAFLKQWALETLGQAMDRLRKECSAEDVALLNGAARPDLSESDRKNRLHRLRQRLRECLREIVRASVERESDVEDEVRELLATLG
ncbi:MAG: sigma-70 family RNA polymerase sigma factor [Planctomycetes bacterium]|nr:sigma-70 family RNA polymerase sigma factor [Planctomycetota bacterium]